MERNDMTSKTSVPLISSGIAGPLGVLHLPRLWLKLSLEACGKLAKGYPGIGGGFDTMTINALGLNADAVRTFIREARPTYPQFEEWIKKWPGVKLDDSTVCAHNESIVSYKHEDATRQKILGANSIPDDANANRDAVNLNNLDDWKEFHAAELANPSPAKADGEKETLPSGTFMAESAATPQPETQAAEAGLAAPASTGELSTGNRMPKGGPDSD